MKRERRQKRYLEPALQLLLPEQLVLRVYYNRHETPVQKPEWNSRKGRIELPPIMIRFHRRSGGDVMPEWSNKDERQYEKIKESSQKRGVSTDRAKEIAARTVNKQRREEGRTPKQTTSGTGNPSRSLEDRPRQELYNRAKQLGIKGRSKMNKQELVRAIRGK